MFYDEEEIRMCKKYSVFMNLFIFKILSESTNKRYYEVLECLYLKNRFYKRLAKKIRLCQFYELLGIHLIETICTSECACVFWRDNSKVERSSFSYKQALMPKVIWLWTKGCQNLFASHLGYIGSEISILLLHDRRCYDQVIFMQGWMIETS